MGFQDNVIGDSIIFPCLPGTGIPVIPARKFITFFGTAGKGNGIANLCGNIPAFHLSTICVKSDGCFCFLPCGVIGSVLPGCKMLLPCISCKYSQFLVFIPSLKAVALSGSLREYRIRAGNDLLTFRLTRAAIIDISQGDKVFFLPLCVEVKVICQADFLSGHIACP